MVSRPVYLEKIRPYIDKPLVKVLTGIRRCGKSTVLEMVRDELRFRGVAEQALVYLNFESMTHSEINTSVRLYDFVRDRVQPGTRTYLFLDEIQEVEAWERAIDSFLVDFDCDVYLTGSNSRLLSGELATYLAGRYVEIPVSTLSYAESLEFAAARGKQGDFVTFLRLGGFPVLHTSDYSFDQAYQIVGDLYASATLRDIVQRHKIRNLALLEKIVKFAFENVGNLFSAKKVADYFKSQQRKVDIETVYAYLAALEQAFILYKVPRYNIQGKEILAINEKYYLGDPALKFAVLGFRDRDLGGTLENLVYLELRRRGYQVFVGIIGDKEIDFVALRKDEKVYVQVAYKLADENTVAREFGAFAAVRDHYPKYVVTMEEFWQDNVDGVRHRNLADFLLMDSY
ncbi:MAG: ATP-binding protein [Spirochaetales bacterium]